MAGSNSLILLFSCLFLLSNFFVTIHGGPSWVRAAGTRRPCPERITLLHFYFHDTVSGRTNATAKRIAGPPPFEFGTLMAANDPLTEGPEIDSRPVGYAQGMYEWVTEKESVLFQAWSFAFSEGEYNGSSLSVVGRNSILNGTREMPIVGGSGLFRLARGYVLLNTFWFHSNGDAVVEYNAKVFTQPEAC